MKIILYPKSRIGQISLILSIIFLILILLKITLTIPLSTFIISALGIAGFITGIIALIKRDLSIGSFFSILVGLGIIVVFAIVGTSSLGIFKGFSIKDSLAASEIGDAGNEIVNFGTVSQKDGWIYYVYEDTLYKRKLDWTGKAKVSENKISKIYISGDWIYYQDSVNGGNLFKMKTDGTGETKITDDQTDSFLVSDEWIFYNLFKTSAIKTSSDSLYKIKTDGTKKMKLADVKLSDNLKIKGDWLYYNSIEDNKKGMTPNLYRIRTDGTENSLVINEADNYLLSDWIYYTSSSNGGTGIKTLTVYKAKPDGTEQSLISTLTGVNNFCFGNDYFYYSANKGLYRINLDGSGNKKLNDVKIWSLEGVSGDWFYITDYDGPTFRVNLDGSTGTKLN